MTIETRLLGGHRKDKPTQSGSVQFRVVRFFLVPILFVRTAKPDDGYGWEWSRWRFAALYDACYVNQHLEKLDE